MVFLPPFYTPTPTQLTTTHAPTPFSPLDLFVKKEKKKKKKKCTPRPTSLFICVAPVDVPFARERRGRDARVRPGQPQGHWPGLQHLQ